MAFCIPMARASIALAIFCFLVALTRDASADAATCIGAHATAQRELNAGHVRLASKLFTVCGSDESCPVQLRKECAEFLQSVKRTVPTVIFSVLDGQGGDVSNVKIFAGDELLVDGLNGRAVAVDPGKYHLRFVLPDGKTLHSDVIIRESEKERLIQVQKDKEPTDDETTPPAKRLSRVHYQGHADPAPWLVAGAAVAGFGVGATLGFIGMVKMNELDQCKPTCPSVKQTTYDSAKTLFFGADVGFGVGLVASGVATWLFVSSGNRGASTKHETVRRHPPSPIGVVTFGAGPVRGGGEIAMAGTF